MAVSKTQIDRLGERLKGGPIERADLQMLDEYRRSFSDAHDAVLGTIRERLSLQPTGRSAKSTPAIVDKLRRESIRLSQIQDIAGCRLVVPDMMEQDDTVIKLRGEFPTCHVIDRRSNPSHGYRAVHVVAESSGKAVEIQVRTTWQHKWAEFSEKCADAFGMAIKYGGGDAEVRELLLDGSKLVSVLEVFERGLMSRGANEQVSELLQTLRKELLAGFEQATAIVVGVRQARNAR